MVLGRVKRERGDLSGALAEFELARRASDQKKQPPLKNLNFLRGDVLARLQRNAEAEAAFRQEVGDFPTSSSAWTGLTLLYASEGNEAGARAALVSLEKIGSPGALFAAARTYEVLGDADSARRIRQELHRRYPGARERKSPAG